MNVKQKIYNVLRGGFLVDDASFKNWRIIIFIVALLLIMISSAHKSDKKVVQIIQLHKKKRELKNQYADVVTILKRLEMESNIRNKVKSQGLVPAKTPPTVINVISKK